MIDEIIGVIPLVLVVAFIMLIVTWLKDRSVGPVERMKQATGGVVMLLVALMVVFAFVGGGGDGPQPPEPGESYDVHFYVASDSAGYGTVSISSLQEVPEGTAVTVAQTISVGGAGQCTATPAADTSQYAYAFAGWTGADDASTPAPASIDADTAYYAHFTSTERNYTAYFHVATDSQGYGTVSVQSVQDVPYGTSVTVAQTIVVGSAGQCTASPEASTSEWEYSFVKWTGADDGSTPAPETVNADVHYYAHFTRAAAPQPMDPSLFTFTVADGEATVTGWAGTPPADGYDLWFPTTDGQGHPLTSIGDVASSASTRSPWDKAGTLRADTVETVGNFAFKNATLLASVSLPSATTIMYDAFDGCTALASVSLPSATTIMNSAFNGCTALASVSLPSATTIKTYAFDGCTGITSVALGPLTSLTQDSFNSWTFYDSDGTTVLGKTAANLANSTFQGTASALIKVAPGAKSLSPQMQERASELAAENSLKASMLADLDPELAGMDSSDVARMTVEQIRGLTSEDVQALKEAVRAARSSAGESPRRWTTRG